MGSWGMARRVAEACASSVAGGVTAAGSSRGKRVSTAIGHVRFPASRTFHHLSQTLTLFSLNPSCSSSSETSVGFRRPDEIPWQKELTNKVCLIGHINRTVDIKYLDSGKIVSSTSVRVKRSSLSTETEDTVFSLQFWDELAEIAAAHLKKEDHVYIAGSVWVENFVDKDNLQRSICKVVARDLKFVGKDYRATNDRNSEANQFSSVEDQWKDYFENPLDYWDNRVGKINPRYPDFKHKASGVGLWIESKKTPSWVIDRLEQGGQKLDENSEAGSRGQNLRNNEQGGQKLDENSEAGSRGDKNKEREKLWQAFFANPSDWWDNRDSKKSSKYPDFKSKTNGDALWVESYGNPIWVKSQLQAMDLKAKTVKEGGGRVSGSKDKSTKSSFEDDDLGFF